jgi:hypothetical protein
MAKAAIELQKDTIECFKCQVMIATNDSMHSNQGLKRGTRQDCNKKKKPLPQVLVYNSDLTVLREHSASTRCAGRVPSMHADNRSCCDVIQGE